MATLLCAFVSSSFAAENPLPIAALNRSTPVDFEKEVLPIFRANCLACHNRTKAKAELILETPADIKKGGDSGPALVPGRSADSLLFKSAAHQADPVMPPKGNKSNASNLTPEQLALLKLWIDQGAIGEVSSASSIAWQPLPENFAPIYATTLTMDGQYAAAGRGNRIHLYHIPSSRELGILIDPALQSAAHPDVTSAVAFSPDGRFLASGSYREVKIWKRHDDHKLLNLPRADHSAISADGRLIALTIDSNLKLHDAAGKPTGEIALPEKPSSLSFSPDSSRIVAVFPNHDIQIFDPATRKLIAKSPSLPIITSLAWLKNPTQFAVAAADGSIRIFALPADPVNGVLTQIKDLLGHIGPATALAAPSATDNQLLSAGGDNVIRLWNIESSKILREIKTPSEARSIAITPDAKRLAILTADGSAKLYDAEGKQLAELKGDRDAILAVAGKQRDVSLAAAETAHRKTVLTAAESAHKAAVDRVKKASQASTEAEKPFAEKQKALADATAKKAAGEKEKLAADKLAPLTKAVADAEREFKKVEQAKNNADNELNLAIKAAQSAADAVVSAQSHLEAGESDHQKLAAQLESLKKTEAATQTLAAHLALSADGALLLTATASGDIHFWNAQTGAPLDVIRGKTPLRSITASSRHLLASADQTTLLSITPTWKLDRTLGQDILSDRVNALAFSDDSSLLAAGAGVPSRTGEIRIWQTSDWKPTHSFDNIHSDAVLCLDFSHDGKLLASGAADRFARLTDLASGKVIRSFEGHTHHILGISLKSDARTLATAGADNVAKIWDATTGDRRKNIEGYAKEVTSIVFIGDGEQLLTTSGDPRVRMLKPDGADIRSFSGAADFIYSSAISHDGQVLIAGGLDGRLHVWNAQDARLIATFPAPSK